MDEAFSRAQLLSVADLVAEAARDTAELARRANLKLDLWKRAASVIDDRRLDILLFVLEYGPCTAKDMRAFFNKDTLRNALMDFEVAGVLHQRGTRWYASGLAQDL